MMKLFYTALPASLLILASCSGGGDAEVIVRELPAEEQEFRIVETSSQRFRDSMSGAASAGHEGHAHAEKKPAYEIVYDLPEGWSEKPSAMMRDVNLSFGAEGNGECYLSRLPGAGGGLMANVNRWRKQMGAAPMTEEEINSFPKKTLFGQPATLVDVAGEYGGMSGTEGKKDYRLLGLILSNNAGAVFVKMIGPAADVSSNEEHFDQFISSLDVVAK